MSRFIHFKSAKFPILPGESEELVNEGTYGKSLAIYLQSALQSRGYAAPAVLCEDWGWWVSLTGHPFTFGVCIYSYLENGAPTQFVCTDGANGAKKWSWSRFRFIDTTPAVDKLHRDLMAILEADREIEVIAVTDEFPF